ncbi:RNA polymerase sigma-70 factor (ECF subfamily) [Lipingzhangella halophila]|uniref:RNA polymerase sigma-70 factor (ECF subfamily) n=1 Tax=Lipingzhangella halophila TaxID=1783352 RepID=A0A7W7RCK8_9ACTN|nr:sigma-70 family RNA polymerase sigma factor [Lipingzhangella halophila]MBB4929439.1 RNA polymerase sigma-70 factor (ECF subfamily) [Lipingzhangella halophila]
MELIDEFEAARPRLLSLAHRMLGSVHDAEDVVQAAWLRTRAAKRTEVQNPDGWFTTVTARLCLDQLRARERRGELPLLADAIPSGQIAADEDFLHREDVSRALLVLLDQLTPAQRVAYVLHDLFSAPFEQVATVLGTSPTNAKKQASRARLRIREHNPDVEVGPIETAEHARIVEAFLAAARGGDIDTLITLMAPDVVRTVAPDVLPGGAAAEVRGARNVAQETRNFIDRIHASVPMLVNGRAGAVIAPGGHPLALIRFEIAGDRITTITIARPRQGPEVRYRRP